MYLFEKNNTTHATFGVRMKKGEYLKESQEVLWCKTQGSANCSS